MGGGTFISEGHLRYEFTSCGYDVVWNLFWLVVLNSLKNTKVNGKDYPIYDGK